MITLSIALKGGGRKRAVLAIIRSVAVAAEFHLLDAKLLLSHRQLGFRCGKFGYMNTLEKLANVPQQKPFCAACRKEMWLIRIEPDEPGYEIRSFECAGCGRKERVQTPSP